MRNKIPAGWEIAALEDVVDILDRQRVPVNAKERAERKGDIPYYGATGQVGWIDDYLFDEELVLLGEDGAPFLNSAKQKAYIIRGKAWVNNHAHVLRARGEIPNAYLKYYLDIVDYHDFVTGTTRLKLNQTSMKKIPIPIAPLEQQKRIVAEIEKQFSRLDEAVANLGRVKVNLKRYKASVLKDAVEGKLTEEWRNDQSQKLQKVNQLLANNIESRKKRYADLLDEWEIRLKKWEISDKKCKKPTKPKKLKEIEELSSGVLSSLPSLPDGWFWAPVSLMTCGVQYGTSSKSTRDGIVPVLRMGNIQNGKFDWTDLVYTSDICEIEKYSLVTGDVLFNRTNSPELVGKTAIFKEERSAIFAGYLIRINHIETIVDSRYLTYFLNSQIAREYGSTVKTDGVNQSNINGEKLINYPFPFCSIREQKIIADKLDEELSIAQQAEDTINKQLIVSESLRQSVLTRAFSGELVLSKPEDEPASVLVRRIKREQQDKAKRKKGNRKSKRKKMVKITKELVVEIVEDLPTDEFTFKQLQEKIQLDYDELKDIIFNLLSSEKPPFKQVFDESSKQIRFIRVKS